MLRPGWAPAALLSLLAAAILLLRAEPLPLWWCAPLLLLWPWAGSWRWHLTVVVALGSWMAWVYADQWQNRVDAPRALSLQGTVDTAVQIRDGGLRFGFQPDDQAWGRLRVAWYREAPAVAPGDCWLFQLRVGPPRGRSNPGGFDYEAWLFREAYAGVASVISGKPCGHVEPGWREHWQAELDALQRPRAVATLRALLLGERDGLAAADWEILRRTGTSHLFAISGLHLGLIAGVAFALGTLLWRVLLWRWLPRSRDVAVLCAALAAIGYAAVSGFAVPVQRALVMCLMGLLVLLSGRRDALFGALGLAAILVLAVNPLAVLMPGFWMSFVAALAIICYLQAYPGRARWRQLLEIQLLLGICLWPLGALFFGGVSLMALPVNLLLVPLFSLLLPLWLLAALLHLGAGWDAPLALALSSMERLWALLERAASVDGAWWQLPEPHWLVAGLAVVAVLLLMTPRRRLRLGGMLLLIGAGWMQLPDRPAPGTLRLWVWDVGQGQSVLIQTSRQNWLYDAGPAWPGGFDSGEQLVAPALRALGISQLEGLIVSHGDNDHAGGAAAIRRDFAPGIELGAGGQPCVAGQVFAHDDVRFEMLHPDAGPWSDNDGSCVLRVTSAAGPSALLTGDIESAAEQALLRAGRPLKAEVLLVPHHGSASSSGMDFITAVAPAHALVSAAADNRWGFPVDAVQARYARQGARLRISGETGAIRVDLDDEGARISAWRHIRPRLWRSWPSDD